MSSSKTRVRASIAILSLGLLLTGCRRDMQDQPRLKPYVAEAQRLRPEGAVPHKKPGMAVALASPKEGDDSFPFALNEEVLKRGQERFNISCSPCHGRLGDGEGLVVKRGFRRPPSFTDERLLKEPVSHFYDVITNGIGAMSSYADQLNPEDRYKVIAYIRALQLSQRANAADLTPEQRQKLETSPREGHEK
jgi:mono/diheme cytochrome c family protein